jgi:iron complex transport system substrate-binding protein
MALNKGPGNAQTAGPSTALRSVEKHFQERTTEPQISPLRCAPVEMTKGRAVMALSRGPGNARTAGPSAALRSGRKTFQERTTEPQIFPLRCAPVEMTKGRAVVALSRGPENAQTAGPSTALRSGRDDNSVCARKTFSEECVTPAIELSSPPERSEVEGPAVGRPRAMTKSSQLNQSAAGWKPRTLVRGSGVLTPLKRPGYKLRALALVAGTPNRVEPLTRRAFVTSMFSLALTTRLSAQTKPARIVSTAPSITEALFALGLGSQVVGVSRFCDFPPEVQKLPKVGTYIKPDPEAIARLAPNLVILQGNPTELTNRLDALHIAFVEVPHGTLKDVFTGIGIIAKAAGYPERAEPLVSRIQAGLDAIQTKAKALPSPRVLIIADRRQGTLTDLISIGPDNYVNEVLQIAGGINVLAKADLPHYPRISLETVLRENPEVLIDLSGTQESEADREAARAATLALWRQNGELTAVRKGHVYVGTTNALLVPGPRTVEAAQRLFDYLHGNGNQN